MIVGGIPMLFGAAGGGPITSIGTLGTGGSNTSNTTLVLTTSAAAEAGNVVILTIAKDNVSTTDGNTTEVSSVADSSSNTWTKLREFCNGQGGANLGAVVSVWQCKVSTTIASGGTITATFASAITAKAMSAWEFQTTGTLEIAGTPVDLANDAADAGSMAISGLASGEYLFFRGIAFEDTGSFTPTASFTAITAAAGGGVGGASMQVQGEFIILTGTGATSDPSNNSKDQAAVFFALKSV